MQNVTHGGHKTTLGEKREGAKENVFTNVTLPKIKCVKREIVVLQEKHSDVSGIKTINRNRENCGIILGHRFLQICIKKVK